MLLDVAKRMSEVNKVENVHFNFAVSKTLGKIEKEASDTKTSSDFTPAMKAFYHDREKIVEAGRKKTGADAQPVIENEEEVRKAVAIFNEANKHVQEGRRRQMKLYREKLRERFSFLPHFIPVINKDVKGVSREYVPENITIEDLFNAAITIDFCEDQLDQSIFMEVDVTPEIAMRASSALSIIGKLKARNEANQKDFATRITYNLFQMHKISFEVQLQEAYSNWLENYEVRRIDVIESCSKKNIYGDAERSARGEYTIEDIDRLNSELAALDSECAEIIEAHKNLMNAPTKVRMQMVPYEWLPENITGDQMKIMYNFILEEKPEE